LFRPTNRRSKNVAARINNIASGETPISLTTVAGQSSMDLMAEGFKNMIIETALFIAFVVAGGAVIVKAYEWHQDVLYGPYMKRAD
jgi:hypothetical protein